MSTDSDWQAWGTKDPYFGVLAHERFRATRLSPEAYDEFFRSGRKDFGEILADCRRYFGEVSPRRSLEFGCGVGRLLIPLSEISELCVGIDISAAMREEAARNCARFNRNNVRLVSTVEEAGRLQANYSFIHSYIVLQHLDPRRGLSIIDTLLSLLDKGGCAALHVTYARTKYRKNLGAQPFTHALMQRLRYPISRFFRHLRNRDPLMQMNAYDLNRVLFLAQQRGLRSEGCRFTDHTGHLGLILYFKRDA
jgi:SAM-dependent methyltransferase